MTPGEKHLCGTNELSVHHFRGAAQRTKRSRLAPTDTNVSTACKCCHLASKRQHWKENVSISSFNNYRWHPLASPLFCISFKNWMIDGALHSQINKNIIIKGHHNEGRFCFQQHLCRDNETTSGRCSHWSKNAGQLTCASAGAPRASGSTEGTGGRSTRSDRQKAHEDATRGEMEQYIQ